VVAAGVEERRRLADDRLATLGAAAPGSGWPIGLGWRLAHGIPTIVGADDAVDRPPA
jgi:hypothetical protein